MPMCGLLGGARLQIEYGRDARLLFDYFFPGVLPGTVFDVPALPPAQIGALTQSAAQAAAAGFITGNPAQQAQTLQWLRTSGASVLPFGPPYPPSLTVASIATTAGYAAGYSLTFTSDLLARVADRIPVDNTTTVYDGSFDDELLNATIARYDDEPPAVAYFRRLYETTGRIGTRRCSRSIRAGIPRCRPPTRRSTRRRSPWPVAPTSWFSASTLPTGTATPRCSGRGPTTPRSSRPRWPTSTAS
jgi:hypothetical protein